MTELDGIFPGLATELVGQFGKNATYVSIAHGVRDLSTGKNLTVRATTPIKVTPPEAVSTYAVAQGLAEADDVSVDVSGEVAVTPRVGHKVILDEVEYNIEAVEKTYSGERVALYSLRLRAS